ncbi:HD domain-containing protein [Metallumcola ferriviriculae]|uniref:HD domain-containing protein n=1 Tax=Metallumcola ferriviriculae TaxID=3039180 RepID=A0AAU0UJT8_9FIRM|nr:HD domain-containing protein [Desulfitibacteraceae bacterium MK1]
MQRVRTLLADNEFKENIAKIASKEKERQFCRHDLHHFLDVARICYQLWLEEKCPDQENIDKEIIYTAALLHDIGRWQEYDGAGDHALISSEMAHTILERLGFNRGEISIITQAISVHRKINGRETVLGRMLYRADKLSRLCHVCPVQDECYKYHYLKEQDIY